MQPPNRSEMLVQQLAERGVRDPLVLEAMASVPRELFVPPAYARYAYVDSPLPIKQGQMISQPYMVARMIEAAGIDRTSRVLEVGTGSGYAAAVLAHIASEVYTIERHAELARDAEARLARLDIHNAFVRHGDGTLGWPEKAPFDAIVVAAGAPEAPRALVEQLGPGGRLVIPIGMTAWEQRLVRIARIGPGEVSVQDLGAVVFVPLIGEQGWRGIHARDPDVMCVRRALAAYD
jgi:protein-L-isoaspartate(D-aspartate) O-methyltransferase